MLVHPAIRVLPRCSFRALPRHVVPPVSPEAGTVPSVSSVPSVALPRGRAQHFRLTFRDSLLSVAAAEVEQVGILVSAAEDAVADDFRGEEAVADPVAAIAQCEPDVATVG